MSEMVKLRKCPLCGIPASLFVKNDKYYVHCDDCSCRTPDCENEEMAIEWWNIRPSDTNKGEKG